MRDVNVRNPSQALAYIVDCTLATVGNMATLKSRNKREYKRQISIAQKGVDWMEEMGISSFGSRAEDIIGVSSVEKWAKQFSIQR